MRAVLLIGCLAACTTGGSLELNLQLPDNPELRPANASRVTLTLSSPNTGPVQLTSALSSDGSFSFGELPEARDQQLSIELRSDANQIVGLGHALEPVDLVKGSTQQVTIPVRRPLLFATTDSRFVSYDPAHDPRDDRFQTSVPVAATSLVAVDGVTLVAGGMGEVTLIDTATMKESGTIELQTLTAVTDLARVPGRNLVVAGHGEGLSIIDLDSKTATPVLGSAIDRVAVGTRQGHTMAYGLVGRVDPTNTAACSGSSIVAIDLEAPVPTSPVSIGHALSSIAAADDALFGAQPCDGIVSQIELDGTATQIAKLPRAAALRVLDRRLFAVGNQISTAVCEANGASVPCTASAATTCPTSSALHVSYVSTGSRLWLQIIPLPVGATPAQSVVLTELRETVVSSDDPSQQHAQVLHPLDVIPYDLAVMEGGQFVGILARSRYFIEELSDSFQVILPCMSVTSSSWMLMDVASISVADRIRTKCTALVSSGAFFANWTCADPPLGEQSTLGEYEATRASALFETR